MQADYGINIVTCDITTIVYYAKQFFWFHFDYECDYFQKKPFCLKKGKNHHIHKHNEDSLHLSISCGLFVDSFMMHILTFLCTFC